LVDATSNNAVQGNFVGTDVTGTLAVPNTGPAGIWIGNGASNNSIGGLAPGAGNLISGNINGMLVQGGASGNLIQGNHIGTDVTGTASLGNPGVGILLEKGAHDNQVGGTSPSARNLISGNGYGVALTHAGTTGNVIIGNYVGTDVSGSVDLGNARIGVYLHSGAHGNTIGGTAAGAGNLIRSNDEFGVRITHSGTDGNVVEGNSILDNSLGGVLIEAGARSNVIGGTVREARNIVSGNGGNGIAIIDSGTSDNLIQVNAIADNSAAGVLIEGGASRNTVEGVMTATLPGSIRRNQHGVVIRGSGTTENVVRAYVVAENAGAGVLIEDSASRNTIGGSSFEKFNAFDSNQTGVLIRGSGTTENVVRLSESAHNRGDGVLIDNAPANLISDTFLWANDGHGLVITGSSARENEVRFNLIRPFAAAEPGNAGDGLRITGGARDNVVLGNRLESNGGNGIRIDGSSTAGNQLQDNDILRNRGDGVLIDGAFANVVSGDLDTRSSVIAGNFGDGVEVRGAGAFFNRVEGIFIGFALDGTPLGNRENGVRLHQAPFNTVRSNLSRHNLGHGVLVDRAADNVIEDNGIADNGLHAGDIFSNNGIELRGPEATRNSVVHNRIVRQFAGVHLHDAPDNFVGGDVPLARNLLINNLNGIRLKGTDARGNLIQGNWVFNSLGAGIFLEGAPDNLIGGSSSAATNEIQGNQSGILLRGAGATGNRVQGNFLRTDIGELGLVGNRAAGVAIDQGASNNRIGGLLPHEGNLIRANGGDGVRVVSGTGNAILSNSIYDNDDLGIDLGNDGVTPNDAGGDPDTGPNNLQNFPDITLAHKFGAPIVVQGSLHSLPDRVFTIQIFRAPLADPSGHGEGRYLLHTFELTTNSLGNAVIDVEVPGPPAGYITATATLMVDHDGNRATPPVPRDTSEFSAARKITGGPGAPDSPPVTDPPPPGPPDDVVPFAGPAGRDTFAADLGWPSAVSQADPSRGRGPETAAPAPRPFHPADLDRFFAAFAADASPDDPLSSPATQDSSADPALAVLMTDILFSGEGIDLNKAV